MTRVPDHVLAAAEQQHGVVSGASLLAAGVSQRRVEGLVAGGVLRREYPGVFVVAGSADTELRRLVVLCTRYQRAVVGRTTGGRLWNIRGTPGKKIELITPSRMRLVVAGASVYRSRFLPPIDVVRRSDGIRVTSPARTLFDLADVVDDATLEAMIAQCLRDDLVSRAALNKVLSRLAGRGRPGSTRFRLSMGARATGQPTTESDLEQHFLRALQDAGLPEPVCQAGLVLPDGSGIRFDFAYPDQRLAIEIDGFGHVGRQSEARDRQRDCLTATMGWMTMRFVPHQVWPSAGQAVEQVRLVLEARRKEVG